MMDNKNNMHPSDVFRTNVLFLMRRQGVTYQDIARMSNVDISASYLRQVIKGESKHPTLEKVQVLAKIFKIQPWQLIFPGLPSQITHATEVGTLIDNYLNATKEGQHNIELTAELVPKVPAGN